eukprot:CAMPEP_0177692542 /NCGR_PEP_ID=MMETSP0484_2-20121128/1908_1 /TAXON_ID=354590 /ORGANISM="Rhodomonas lens, Strain RHODO" /LENGTH=345 /DNA_ID=CAMNT_0019203265 /DNA_START=105 /DNA_END=1139 /DNA_ORIENTATION=-
MRNDIIGLLLAFSGVLLIFMSATLITMNQAEAERPGKVPRTRVPRESLQGHRAPQNRSVGTATSRRRNASRVREKGSCLKFYTVASQPTSKFCMLLRTAVVAGVDLNVLGMGLEYAGNEMKLRYMVDELASVPPDCVIVFIDAYDVLFANTPPQQTLARYRQMTRQSGDQLIFSAECNCLAHNRSCEDFPPSPPGFPSRFPNSGGWISPASLAITFFKAVIANIGNKTDVHDQAYANDIFRIPELRERYSLGLDYRSRIFLSLTTGGGPGGRRDGVECRPVADYNHGNAFKNGVWTDPKRRVSPAVVHFNGGGKLFMGEWFNVWRQWWYGGGGKQKRDHPDGRVW